MRTARPRLSLSNNPSIFPCASYLWGDESLTTQHSPTTPSTPSSPNHGASCYVVGCRQASTYDPPNLWFWCNISFLFGTRNHGTLIRAFAPHFHCARSSLLLRCRDSSQGCFPLPSLRYMEEASEIVSCPARELSQGEDLDTAVLSTLQIVRFDWERRRAAGGLRCPRKRPTGPHNMYVYPSRLQESRQKSVIGRKWCCVFRRAIRRLLACCCWCC